MSLKHVPGSDTSFWSCSAIAGRKCDFHRIYPLKNHIHLIYSHFGSGTATGSEQHIPICISIWHHFVPNSIA